MVVKKMENEEYAVACTEVLEILNYISKEDIAKVLKFQKNPNDPSWME